MSLTFRPLTFAELPGWGEDNHAAALAAFSHSAPLFLGQSGSANNSVSCDLRDALRNAGSCSARRFFECWFEPHAVVGNPEPGLVTGYYEPHIRASRTRSSDYPFPVYRRPPDLVNVVDEALRGTYNGAHTHLRQTSGGLEPYPTRREIDLGALKGRNLELAFVSSQVELFFLHIQGSGVLMFEDGSGVRVSYDGKNGHPYTSIGKHLISSGHFTAAELTMPALIAWLEADAGRARDVMWINESYIFFRALEPDTKQALGVNDIPLTPGRSLAVDGGVHRVGTPIYVVASELPDPVAPRPFQRLMIAQDAGSAIRGAERGDIYYGSGDVAGRQAGITKHHANFFILRLRSFGPGAAGAPLTDSR